MRFHQPFLQINNRKDNNYNMNFDEMSLDELKEYAKQNNVKVGNIGREKLIEKLKGETSVCSMADDNDFVEDVKTELDLHQHQAIIPIAKINEKYLNYIRIYFEWENVEANNATDSELGQTENAKISIPLEINFKQYTGEVISNGT